MSSTQQYFISLIGIIIGSLGIGFAIGCRVMANAATRLVEQADESDMILDAEEIDA